MTTQPIEELQPAPAHAATDEELIDAAARIAESLCRTAFWDAAAECCNWLGRADEGKSASGPAAPCMMALGPHLYAGSAGIALFLSELAAITRDEDVARTARGAMTRSLRQRRWRPDLPLSALSFWTGQLGIAWVARRVAELGILPSAREAIPKIFADLRSDFEKKHQLDVIAGNAGGIPALLTFATDPEHGQEALSLARLLGDELCERARFDQGVAVWDVEDASGVKMSPAPMTGYSHGAAGFGYALLALHAATGDERYQRYGRGAFAYEDALFNPVVGNWPDMRAMSNTMYNTGSAYITAWCHGAPGIGLARLRAMAADPDNAETHEVAARAAINTTLVALQTALATPRADTTLCHGALGLSEVVLTGGELLDNALWRTYARTTAAELIDRYVEDDAWPTAAPMGGWNPAFLIGTAGIGYHFLRVAGRVAPVMVLPAAALSGATGSQPVGVPG